MRYEDVPDTVSDFFREVRNNYFPELRNARIKLLFDTKKKKKNNFIVFASIKKTDEVVKHLTVDEAGNDEGYHYICFINKLIWENIGMEDRLRIARHELRHCYIDAEAKSPYKIIDHDLKDFYDEVELNSDDPRWSQRIAEVAESLYEEE